MSLVTDATRGSPPGAAARFGPPRVGAALMATAFWLAVILAPGWAQIPPADDAPKSHTPDESRAMFRLPEGFRIELVAGAPYLADPVDMAFDAAGRIFVCEIHGYNLEGYYDILELNKTGVLDTAVRRIDASQQAQRRAADGQYGTVKLLEDTDGDGRVDKSSVWADRLPPCYGVVAARDGVVVICPPDIVFLADRDGDGRAEVREKLYKTGGGPMWNRPSNPRWNLDNWIYYDGGFRFHPGGSAHEPSTGSGQFGQAVSDWGDRFYMVQVQPVRYVVPLAHRYLARNPYHGAKGGFVSLLPYNDVYPISRPHPWRMKRGSDPAWLKFYGAAEATPNGFVTSACGNVIYRGETFPPEYRGNYFFCENAQNFIHRCLLSRDGAGWKAARARDDKVEFLASPEIWFRPVNLHNGPDGALYIVDMYREIIEDYSAIPRFLQQQYVESLIAGHDRGRIWRLQAEGAPPWRKFDLRKAPTAELVRELAHANAWHRETAQRLLVERADPAAAGPLAAMVREGKTPQARLHALCTLEGLGALEPAVIEAALADPHFAVRTHAVRVAEPWLDRSPRLLQKFLAMVDDPDAKVRLQLALSLGECTDGRVLGALAELAARHGDEPWMADAVLSSVPDRSGELMAMLLSRPDGLGNAAGLLGPLASVAGVRRDDDELGRVLDGVAGLRGEGAAGRQGVCLRGLIDGLQRGKPKVMVSSGGQEAMGRLLRTPSGDVRRLAVTVAGLVKLRESAEMRAALAEARKTAFDRDATPEERAAAIALLASAPFDEVASAAERLFDAREPLPVQLAAVEAVASSDNAEVATLLLDAWPGYTPQVRSAVLEAVFGRENRLPGLLDAIEAGLVERSALDAARRRQLTGSRDTEVRRRAEALLAGDSSAAGRADVLAKYRAALTLDRDAARGEKVFDRECAKCHKLAGRGYEVGPELSVIKTRADQTLVSDVMDPSAEITVGYHQYTVLTEDGRIFTGVLAGETATSITLRKEEGVDQTILRREIDEMQATTISMMPEDLEKQVTPQEVADLIAFLRTATGSGSATTAPVVTLFDDDPAFAALLTEGKGKLTVRSGDCYSGRAALAVTPPQRFSADIPGWGYRIVENPGPGEFRYLRFAWKSRGARGVMLELAADGRWPPAEKPLCRYYCGQNTTPWQAVQVAADAPGEWTVVTRDLWQDFGPMVLTGIAPTAMGGEALFDRIELLRDAAGSATGSGLQNSVLPRGKPSTTAELPPRQN